MSGSTPTLARWFTAPTDFSRADDDFEREALLAAVEQATHVATLGPYPRTDDGPRRRAEAGRNEVLIAAPGCRALLTAFDQGGSKLVDFDVVTTQPVPVMGGRRIPLGRYRFWMNASSVADLGNALRSLPRTPADRIFCGLPVDEPGQAQADEP